MDKKPLPPRARYCLAFIKSYINQHQFPPSMREIKAAMGLKSISGVTEHLGWLERNGWITRSKGKYRSIVIVP